MNLENNEAFYIVSVMHASLTSEANFDRHEETKVWLTSLNIPYKVVKGVYKGVTEQAFLLIADDIGKTYKVATMLAEEYNQECILSVNENREAKLLYPNSETNIGKFQRVVSTAGLDSYTVDLETGQAWTCK